MPRGANGYANPFRFLRRPGDAPKRSYEPRRGDLRGLGGVLECRIVAYSLVDTKGISERSGRRAARFSDYPVIPGSTLKGLVRSIAEFIGGGCFVVGDTAAIPRAWRGCDPQPGRKICPSCAMFGVQKKGNAFRGSVHFSDARPEKWAPHKRELWLYSGSPQPGTRLYPREEPWQKFYHHQPLRRENPKTVDRETRNAFPVFPVEIGSTWAFRVQFSGLDAIQLAVLHYALSLQPGMLHKLGRGKPQGMGSVRIRVTGVEVWGEEDRVRGRTRVAAELPDEVKEERQTLETSADLEPLRLMLWWRPDDDTVFRYPSRHEAKAIEGLRGIEELVCGPFVPSEPADPVLSDVGDERKASGDRGSHIEVTDTQVANCEVVYKPNDGSLMARVGERVVGLATGDRARSVLASMGDLGDRLKRKRRMRGLVVTVHVEGNLRVITKIEQPS